jgi:hypothetical protein
VSEVGGDGRRRQKRENFFILFFFKKKSLIWVVKTGGQTDRSVSEPKEAKVWSCLKISTLEGEGEEEMFVVCEGENAQGVVTVSVFPSIYIHTMMLANWW